MMGDLGGNQKQTLKVEKVSWIHSHWEPQGPEAQPAVSFSPFSHLVPDKVKTLLDLEERQMMEVG